MATRYNIYNSAPAFTPTIRGSWTGAQTTNVARGMGTDKAGQGGSASVAGGATGGVTGQSSWAIRALGPELGSETISGTVDICSPVQASVNDGDFHWQYHLYVVTPSNTVRGTLISTWADTHPSDEWTTSLHGRNAIQRTVTPVACTAGDRVVLELGMIRRANGSVRSLSFGYGGTGADAVSGANGVGWIEFSYNFGSSPSSSRTHAVVLG